ncbi:MAG: DNA internalization-related competence protein ComEC/Rec2 [Gaiella sp.]
MLEFRWPTLLMGAACTGLALANWVRLPAVALGGATLACVLLALCARNLSRLAAFGAALVVAGLWWGGLRADALERSVLAGRLGETGSARVVLTGPARRSRYALRIPAEVRRFGGQAIRERVLLELPPERAPPQGAVLDVRARPVEPRGPETGFDERGWLARQGVHVVLKARDARIVGRRGGIGGVADRMRAHVEQSLASGNRGERRAVLTGIVLGTEEGLSDELRDAFRASGLTHLLAVSGQNVAITAVGVVAAARVFGIGRLAGEGVAIVAVLVYALAVGWEPSVVRATVAGILASLAWIAARPRDRWHFMAFGALVLLTWTPSSLLEPGFQLSFAAVAAMFLGLPRATRIAEGYPVPQKLAELALVAGICGLVTAPIVWLHFGAVALWTVPANVIAEPAMPPLIGLALTAAVVEPLSPEAAAALAWLAGLCAAWIALVARLISALPAAELRSSVVMVALAAAVAAIVGIRLLPRWRRSGAAVAVAGAALVVAVGWWSLRPAPNWVPPAGLRVTFLDVGQGDSVLVEVAQGAVLVDQGVPEADVAGQLRRMGVRSLTALVLTHPQRDHIGGAADVLRRLYVGAVLDPELAMRSSDRVAALRVARERKVPISIVRAGDRYRIGRLRLRVLWPDGAGLPDEDPNRRATVILATYGSTDLLLTADAESDVTGRLPLRAVEVLKVAHHGSEDPGLGDQLRVLRPRLAIVSVGEGNDYGHPRAETIAALQAVPGLKVYRTDRDGRVVLESDGRRLTVRSER